MSYPVDVRTVDAVSTASPCAPVVTSAPGSGSHTLQANRGSATGAQGGAVVSDNDGAVMPSRDRYVASRVDEAFPRTGTYVQEALDLIDGATIARGTRLAVRKNQTTQTISTKESYCPLCQVILATAWSRHHLSSRQHQFTESLLTANTEPKAGGM